MLFIQLFVRIELLNKPTGGINFMKKAGMFLGAVGTVFGLAVFAKMKKMTLNKDAVKGKTKEVTGALVGNEKLQAEGTLDQVIGASKEVIEDAKETVSSVTDSLLGTGKTEQAKEVASNVKKASEDAVEVVEKKLDK